jgi:hypothetical protein
MLQRQSPDRPMQDEGVIHTVEPRRHVSVTLKRVWAVAGDPKVACQSRAPSLASRRGLRAGRPQGRA